MAPKNNAVFMTLLMFLSSGCIGLIEDVSDIAEEIDNTINALGGDYPKLELPERIRTNPNLQNYDQCNELLEDLKTAAYDEMIVSLDQESYWHWSTNILRTFNNGDDIFMLEDGFPEIASDAVSKTPINDREGEFSGTNNQESDVDEADFIKTNGFNIFMLNGNLLLIMGIPEFGELYLESNTSIEGNPIQMMLEGDKLVIASSVNSAETSNQKLVSQNSIHSINLVKYTILNVSNASSPEVVKEVYVEGNYQTARLVDGTVRSITHFWTYIKDLQSYVNLPIEYWEEGNYDARMELWNSSVKDVIENNTKIIEALTLDDFSPHVYEVKIDQPKIFNQLPISSENCSEFSASEDSAGRGFTTIMTLDLFQDDIEIEVDHITSSSSHIYASKDKLIIAEPSNDWWWFWRNSNWEEATNIHVYDISDSTETQYLSSGRVNGTVQDQFSISEYQGLIRVASTSNNWGLWWIMDTFDDNEQNNPTGPTNQVSILEDNGDGTLDLIGYLGNIAPGETIWSARFIGERAYLVTFQNIDPLWVIDLSEPSNLTILGELEVPGVSTYIHPIDDNLLLTIGIAPGPDGLGLDWSLTQISLFDISDPTNPNLSDSLQLTPAYADKNCEQIISCGWSWSWSEATFEHKAFNYWGKEELLAVPLSTHRYVTDQITVDGKDYQYSGYEFISSLQLINVDSDNKSLSLHGDLNHSGFYNDQSLDWWSDSTSIRRSIFMGDYIYSFSTAGASVHRTIDLVMIKEIEIPGFQSVSYYDETDVPISDSSS
ncbi:beta-propeller domain-containing protein [Euryarchaeota archaeon]|nr:beta-propeller domain-containing protein [Euryarchaeota archaeon]|tara:strand:- start:2169 stop:4487 length:2319 start_codon:yes stop_codon:yes gene_type:complete